MTPSQIMDQLCYIRLSCVTSLRRAAGALPRLGGRSSTSRFQTHRLDFSDLIQEQEDERRSAEEAVAKAAADAERRQAGTSQVYTF